MAVSKELANTIRKKKKTDKTIKRPLTEQERKERIKQWCTFYRRNPEIYAEQALGVKLRPFQRFWLYLMARSQIFFAVASRGSAKTFLAGLLAIIECMLYPYSEVVITASTIEQARKIVDVKIKREIVGKLSPVLRYLELQGLIVIKTSKDEARVDFWNGSVINVLPCLDSSRGSRSTMLILEECRLLKKGDVDSIFLPMSHPRQAKFMQLDKYSRNSMYLEEAKELYITSARYSHEWWYRLVKRVIEQSFKSVGAVYDFFMCDVYTSIANGLKTRKDWEKIQQTANEIDIRAEYLNEVIGEVENAYFPLELVSDCQSIRKAFRPTRDSDISKGKIPKNKEKKPNEYRVIGIDFAFASTTSVKQDNDNTVIECVSGVYHDGEIVRHLDYCETLAGSKSEETLKRIRELAEDYQADYIVLDGRSGGETYMTNLSKMYEHPTRNSAKWDKHGYTTLLDMTLQFCTEAKINEIYGRKIDPDAKQMIIPIIANMDFNSTMWISLHQAMQSGKIKMLIDSSKMEFERAESKDWLQLSSEERMFEKLPYVQTELMVVEAINLRQEIRDGRIKLTEPRTGTKDRIVVLAYVNMFFDKLEEKLNRQNNRDLDEWDDEFYANALWV